MEKNDKEENTLSFDDQLALALGQAHNHHTFF
jgi:hypothetical protein